MNLRKNNGFTGIDISVAVIIILLFVPTIFGILYNKRKTNTDIAKETRAIYIATDILEGVKSLSYTDIDLENDNFMDMLRQKKYAKIESGKYSAKGYDTEGYTINITINTLKSLPTAVETKKVTVKVEYKILNKTQLVEINTTL